jgi:SAM-dependent methyltransferase
MAIFYRLAYLIGFTPWEDAANHPAVAKHLAALLDRETQERHPPYGAALDLGCGTGGWAIDLARRGWMVTGIDMVPRAIARARRRAAAAGVDVKFVEGDLTALHAAGVGDRFQFFMDFGAIHGLTHAQRIAVAREVTAVAAPDSTMLMLAWAPGRRGPLPRGMNRAEIEEAFSAWRVIDEQPFDVSGMPAPLRKTNPVVYRVRRDSSSY